MGSFSYHFHRIKLSNNIKYIHSIHVIRGFKMPTVKADDCVGCGACVDVCPQDAIAVDDVAVIDAGKCVDCGACVDECPADAIEE